MILRYLYHRGLAQASYLVGCAANGEALIVDPNRDIQQYIDLAEKEGLKITKITETHIHADYVSGSRELADATGATLYLSDAGPDEWKYAFADESGATMINDGDTIMLGNIKIDVLHTPGHTPEHLSFLVTDTAGADEPMGIFTGDFVFVGDVGRPDLLEKAAGMAGTTEEGARNLFQSIERFKNLPDYVQIWPGHGAGSACGKSLGAVPQSTVGYERMFNWAFQFESEDEFAQAVLEDQPEPPVYFAQMKRINKEGPAMVASLADAKPMASSIDDTLSAGYTVVDTRATEEFANGHIPGTINIPFNDGFVTWAGWFLPYDQPFYLITAPEQIDKITHELRMIGLDGLGAYWPASVVTDWQADGSALESMEHVSVEELSNMPDVKIVDVRGASEYEQGHIPGSTNIPLGHLPNNIDQFPNGGPIVFHCQTGARSAIGTSIALANGVKNVKNLTGGFSAWESSDKPIETKTKAAA